MLRTSVVIPSYNQSPYLAEAIESALAQTTPCEVIVIDDGSTDDSPRIAEQYIPEIKLIKQTNRGLAAARNTGIMNATGDFVLPLDADDILHINAVEALTGIAEETGADVVGPSMEAFGIVSGTTILTPKPTIANMRLGNHLPYFCLFRKSALISVGGYSPKMVEGYEDYHCHIALILKGYKIETTKEVLVKYRTKEKSMWKEAKQHHAKLMAQIYHDFPAFLPA